MITIVVPDDPIGKGRARSTRSGHHYTPEKTRNYEAYVRFVAAQAMKDLGLEPLDGALILALRIERKIPQSWSAKKRVAAAAGQLFPTVKPDVDNVVKMVCDSFNGIVWRDDVQVCDLKVRKRYSLAPKLVAMVAASEVEVGEEEGEVRDAAVADPPAGDRDASAGQARMLRLRREA